MTGLRGDNRMACVAAPDERRPVTMDDVISPVPMNASNITFSSCFNMNRQPTIRSS